MYKTISFLAPLSQLNSYFVNKNLGLLNVRPGKLRILIRLGLILLLTKTRSCVLTLEK